jgi:hypothetical protein
LAVTKFNLFLKEKKMSSSNKSSNNNAGNQNRSVSTPKPISVAPGRNIRSGERPSYQAPIPPKTK